MRHPRPEGGRLPRDKRSAALKSDAGPSERAATGEEARAHFACTPQGARFSGNRGCWGGRGGMRVMLPPRSFISRAARSPFWYRSISSAPAPRPGPPRPRTAPTSSRNEGSVRQIRSRPSTVRALLLQPLPRVLLPLVQFGPFLPRPALQPQRLQAPVSDGPAHLRRAGSSSLAQLSVYTAPDQLNRSRRLFEPRMRLRSGEGGAAGGARSGFGTKLEPPGHRRFLRS